MRLQRLEINGFKSFSDRSELAFDAGVTAIVGPNGCGKSNVADAITWVMGEQSAKSLRGERMEDVLFNGSDARKPTASAEVRLRFSGFLKTLTGPALDGPEPQRVTANGESAAVNGDGFLDIVSESLPAPSFEAGGVDRSGGGRIDEPSADLGKPDTNGNGHANGHGNGHGNGNGHAAGHSTAIVHEIIKSVAREVEVTRRLYRSGESEYLIDGQVCRLKDIHDLLMDTGLGAKAYAIIEQGKIGMILSSRPTDRRQLIEEAAGVTKYKARRRAAELKLEAAQQNLTRIDDIVFEVEKQRGTLKRQAARARRYQKLRGELRQWEKVLFARKYRQLAETIESARARLAEARQRESAAAGRVAELENDLGRLRLELVEADARATGAREAAHARELAINRQEQQIAFDREQVQMLDQRTAAIGAELAALHARREPARAALDGRRAALADANAERDRAGAALMSAAEAYDAAHREIEGLEADVEAARSEVFSAINSATALRHALEHASAARDKVADTLSKLEVETADVRIQAERVSADRSASAEALRRGQEAVEATRIARAARDSELASARIEHEWRARAVRAREHELAGLTARLRSLEELEAARAGYGDAARAVLVQANGKVDQRGAVADYLEVDAGYERAVEACLGDLLQRVIVERPEHAAAGFDLVREAGAGRCGFLVTSGPGGVDAVSRGEPTVQQAPPPDVRPLSAVVRATGPFAGQVREALGDAWIVESYARAAEACAMTPLAVATIEGDVFNGPHLVSGGGHARALGILETKREIKQLRERITEERESLDRLVAETADLDVTIAHATAAIAALHAEHHRQEKTIVAYEAQLKHTGDEEARLAEKAEQLARERRQAEEERDALDRRQEEARTSIAQLDAAQRIADERLTATQRGLFEARESVEALNRRAAEAGAAHAALLERSSALGSEIQRLEEASVEIDQRTTALEGESSETRGRVEELRAAIVAGQQSLDLDVAALETLRREVAAVDDAVCRLRTRTEEFELQVKEARARYEAVRSVVSELDVARATAEADLSHLAHTCEDAVNATLDEVRVEIEQLEAEGQTSPDAAATCPEDDTDEDAEDDSGDTPVSSGDARLLTSDLGIANSDSARRALGAEEAIAALRGKIERLGPVNMMAIEQFEELETRHAFLTTQRNDLVESIRLTTEAIKRIDDTTRQRFSDAFAAINQNFQQMFGTLFGGGRAGLTLLDESDPLESGIEIIAQPPGKRLQSVQLLSGGEKALTAIALMFGMFKYKPSPFCLLDEIDAPLDDANIGRFVEMLRGMQQHTQFIVITHNRKTMEIADRLYGVTMEEPGVSKLISVQLN